MTVVVTHTTPADGTFSAAGAAAWDADHALSGLGTMAEQNKTSVDIEGGTIDNTTIGATTPSTGVFTTLTATGQTSLGGVAGAEGLRVLNTTSSVNYLQAKGSVSGVSAQFSAQGADSNVSLSLSSQGAGTIRFFSNSVGQEQFRVAHTNSAVNYVQVTGAATGSSPAITSQGSDANIALELSAKGTSSINFRSGSSAVFQAIMNTGGDSWLAANRMTGNANLTASSASASNVSLSLQSKGTGAIDLAAGSSGVNISNGGTVTAITRTAAGSGYTSIPSVAISAPTTAGGVQSTATAIVQIRNTSGVTINSGGTGYTVNDVLTVSGGTGTAATFTVATVSGGVITSITLLSSGAYSALPTFPASVTGGTGSSATFTFTDMSVSANPVTITNAGSGYVEQPTVTFSGGGGSGAAAYATVGSGTTVKSLGSTLSLSTAGGEQVRVLNTNAANYLTLSGSGSGSAVAIGAAGTDGGIATQILSKGSGTVEFWTNGGNQRQAVVAHTASAVNYVQVTGAATGSGPIISAQGSDTDVRLNFTSKGTNSVDILTNSSSQRQFRFSHTASALNYFQATGGATGFGPVLSAQGSDTNIPAVVQPKGTGALQAQQTDSTATGGNARGANAVDWQTFTRTSAAQVASGLASSVLGGARNTSGAVASTVVCGTDNTANANNVFVGSGATNFSNGTSSAIVSGLSNTSNGTFAFIGAGQANTTAGFFNVVVGGQTNSATSASAVTTQSATMNGTTAVTLSGSNANIKVGQLIIGTSITSASGTVPYTYVAAISGTSLTLSQAASGSSTSTLSFFTPHGVVVGGGNNQATGSYSFIGGGGDAGTAANRNVASGDWSVVGGGRSNSASGAGAVIVGGGAFSGAQNQLYPQFAGGSASFIGGGLSNNASGAYASIVGGLANIASSAGSTAIGMQATTRAITGCFAYGGCDGAVAFNSGVAQSSFIMLGRQTTDATATVLTSNTAAASTTNQVILPNNSAYYFKGSVIANVTGGGNTKAWAIEGAIKRGANAASTALVGTPTVTSSYADAGASTWAITATADTTNGGLAITFTGQAGTTIRVVAKLETTEVTF